MSGPEPISPELALVSQELAEEARRALPDRPWEAFAPPRPAEPASQLRRAVPATEPTPPGPRAAGRPPRRVVTVTRVVTAALVALLVVTSFLPPRDAPRLLATDPFALAPAAAATPPTFQVRPVVGAPCAPPAGQRDPFRPVCPPGRTP
jgi:hypothetical protein